MASDEYRTVRAAGGGTFTDLRSRFTAFAFPVETAEEAMRIVAEVKRKSRGARHVAYAYVAGADGGVSRSSDDGEPSGTAGRPILGQIRSAGVTNALVAVARYFGGVKLGTGRLAEAYHRAAAAALSDGGTAVRVAETEVSASFGYEKTDGVMRALRRCGARVTENGCGGLCVIKAKVRLSQAEALRESLARAGARVYAQAEPGRGDGGGA